MSEYRKLKVVIEGLCPAIMNNGRKANPMDKFAKAIKEILSLKPRGGTLTDKQMEELAYLEFMGGLYVDTNGRVCWPGENLESMLFAAARKQRRGKDSQIGLLVDGDWPLSYDGPKDVEKLWKDEQFRKYCMAKNKGVPVLKCRPIFNQWLLEFEIAYDPDVLTEAIITDWLEIAGRMIGLSDWRPKYGRFKVVSAKAA